MPFASQYVDSGRGLHKTGTGIVTGTELITGAIQDAKSEELLRHLRYGLVDFTETTDLRVSIGNIRQVVEANRTMATLTPPGVLIAVVAPNVLVYGIARVWHSLTDGLGWRINIFRSRPEAIAWLRKELAGEGDSKAVLDLFPSLQSADDVRDVSSRQNAA